MGNNPWPWILSLGVGGVLLYTVLFRSTTNPLTGTPNPFGFAGAPNPTVPMYQGGSPQMYGTVQNPSYDDPNAALKIGTGFAANIFATIGKTVGSFAPMMGSGGGGGGGGMGGGGGSKYDDLGDDASKYSYVL